MIESVFAVAVAVAASISVVASIAAVSTAVAEPVVYLLVDAVVVAIIREKMFSIHYIAWNQCVYTIPNRIQQSRREVFAVIELQSP